MADAVALVLAPNAGARWEPEEDERLYDAVVRDTPQNCEAGLRRAVARGRATRHCTQKQEERKKLRPLATGPYSSS